MTVHDAITRLEQVADTRHCHDAAKCAAAGTTDVVLLCEACAWKMSITAAAERQKPPAG